MNDSWSYRSARMHPQHSNMEMDIYLMLSQKGIPAFTEETFCIQATMPDFWFPETRLAVYLDGEKVHAKRRCRDSRIRELLAKSHSVKVLSITYKGNSKREKSRVLKEILEVLEK